MPLTSRESPVIDLGVKGSPVQIRPSRLVGGRFLRSGGLVKSQTKSQEAGIRPSPSYTMALCIEDWLSQALAGRNADTVDNYRYAAAHAVSKLGAVKLRDLSARHVQTALAELSDVVHPVAAASSRTRRFPG